MAMKVLDNFFDIETPEQARLRPLSKTCLRFSMVLNPSSHEAARV